jgi:hypothetical protein
MFKNKKIEDTLKAIEIAVKEIKNIENLLKTVGEDIGEVKNLDHKIKKSIDDIKDDISKITKNSPHLLTKGQIEASRKNEWNIVNAKEFLDVIVVNASLDNPQTLIYRDLEVEVVNKNKKTKEDDKGADQDQTDINQTSTDSKSS